MAVVKRTISFEDIDGNPVEAEYYFQLAKTDVVEMDLIHDHQDDMEDYLHTVTTNRDTRELLKIYKEILFRSVARRVGNGLDKSDAVMLEFVQTGAYDALFSELLEEEDGGAAFFMSIMPEDVQEKAAEQAAKTYTTDDLLKMTDEEFTRVAGKKDEDMSRDHLLVAMKRRTMKMAV